MLRDLRGHDVAVVALCHSDKAVGVFDAGPSEDIAISTVADHLVAFEIGGQHTARGGS
jgi:hypothetical protein